MATTTPNYGWAVPTSTDLVKDGATAIETLGDAIDASMNTALGTKKAGMVLLNTTSFSAVASQSINDVFSTTYQNYKIIFNLSASSANDIQMRLRVSAADATTNYNRRGISVDSAGVVTNYGSGNAQTFWYAAQTASLATGSEICLYSPFETVATRFNTNSSGGTQIVFAGGIHTTVASYTGITFITDTGTMTGNVRIYGFNN
jgi:hypothetical protein